MASSDTVSINIIDFHFDEVQLVWGNDKMGTLHIISGHYHEFSEFLPNLSYEENKIGVEAAKIGKEIKSLQKVIPKNKYLILEKERKLRNYCSSDDMKSLMNKVNQFLTDVMNKRPCEFKTSRKPNMMLCWKIENSPRFLVAVLLRNSVPGKKAYQIHTAYTINAEKHKGWYDKLQCWFKTDGDSIHIVTCNEIQNDLEWRKANWVAEKQKIKNWIPVLQSIDKKRTLEEYWKIHDNDSSHQCTSRCRHKLEDIYPGIPIRQKVEIAPSWIVLWEPDTIEGHNYKAVIATQYFYHGLLHSLLLHGNEFGSYDILNDLNENVKETVKKLRNCRSSLKLFLIKLPNQEHIDFFQTMYDKLVENQQKLLDIRLLGVFNQENYCGKDKNKFKWEVPGEEGQFVFVTISPKQVYTQDPNSEKEVVVKIIEKIEIGLCKRQEEERSTPKSYVDMLTSTFSRFRK